MTRYMNYFSRASALHNIFKLSLFSTSMSDDRIQMPSSGAGLTRFFDDYKSKIEIKPEHVIILIVVVIVVELLLNWQGAAWFGL